RVRFHRSPRAAGRGRGKGAWHALPGRGSRGRGRAPAMTGGRPAATGSRSCGTTVAAWRRRSVRRGLAAVALCLLAATAAGCWDYRDLERRSPILGMAVDTRSASDGQGYRVTVEIPYPASGASPGAGGGGILGGGGGDDTQSPKVIVSGEGGTLGAALVSLNARLERQPLWEHLLAIVLSDSVA